MTGTRLLLPALGFGVWASAFVLLYAMLSVGCRFGWNDVDLVGGLTAQRAQLILILIAHMVAGVALVIHMRRCLRADFDRPAAFLGRIGYWAAIAALASSLFTYAAVFGLSACT
jgi:hypothetical protein